MNKTPKEDKKHIKGKYFESLIKTKNRSRPLKL
jgi:hypothetical protein